LRDRPLPDSVQPFVLTFFDQLLLNQVKVGMHYDTSHEDKSEGVKNDSKKKP